MSDQLKPEYFQLLKKVLSEKDTSSNSTKLVKRKTNNNNKRIKLSNTPPPKDTVIINIESESDNNQDSSESDYNSDDFEDVVDDETNNSNSINEDGSLSITFDKSNNIDKKKNKKKSIVKNICSNEVRHYRKFYHMISLILLISIGSTYNKYLNNNKLLKKLSPMLSDNIYNLLNPDRDLEMPLRSTRKLLNGLKDAMHIWENHWKIILPLNENDPFYMHSWSNLTIHNETKNKKLYSKNNFIKSILHGKGNKHLKSMGFVALLRSCNVNARLIFSLQPPDFTDLKEKSQNSKIENDSFKYPIFWCEVWDKFAKSWITIDPSNFKIIEQISYSTKLQPKGTIPMKHNNLRYIIAYDRKFGCRDITRRYAKLYNAKIIKKRITKSKIGYDWYNKLISSFSKRKRTKIDDYEDSYFDKRDYDEPMPDNLQDMKNHPFYVLEKDIHTNQVIRPGSKECGYLHLKSKTQKKLLKVFKRKDIIDLKTGRQWYSLGRILKQGAKAYKSIPSRSRVTLEENEEERLYSMEDTQLYMPPLASPAGEIKTNTFGNIEVFISSMIPSNCVLIESDIAVKAARFINIDFAPAVTKFKFEKRSAKPVISGVVVAKWYKEAVLVAIEGMKIAQIEYEQRDRLTNILNVWNTLLKRLAVKNKLNFTYGTVTEDKENENKEREEVNESEEENTEEYNNGGFLPGLVSGEGPAVEPQNYQESDIENTYNNEPQLSNSHEINGDTTNDILIEEQQDNHSLVEEYSDQDIMQGGGFLPSHNNVEDNYYDDNNESSISGNEAENTSENGGRFIVQSSEKNKEGKNVNNDNKGEDILDTIEVIDDEYAGFMDELKFSDSES